MRGERNQNGNMQVFKWDPINKNLDRIPEYPLIKHISNAEKYGDELYYRKNTLELPRI